MCVCSHMGFQTYMPQCVRGDQRTTSGVILTFYLVVDSLFICCPVFQDSCPLSFWESHLYHHLRVGALMSQILLLAHPALPGLQQSLFRSSCLHDKYFPH